MQILRRAIKLVFHEGRTCFHCRKFKQSRRIIQSSVLYSKEMSTDPSSDSNSKSNFKILARNRNFLAFDKENETKWEGPFVFIQAADTQFGMIDSYVKKKPNPSWEKEIELTKKAILKANKLTPKPRFFVVCGDLVDALPESSLRPAQIQDFKAVFELLDPNIPLICLCGNHDIGDKPSKQSISQYKEDFGDDYFSFWCGGVMFIVLNSQYYEDPSLVMDMAVEQEQWLDKQLEEAKESNPKHVVVFQHIPWFLHQANEEKEYFNIVDDLRLKMLEKFYAAGVRAIFCGHYHRNAGGKYMDLELVVTSAIGAQLGNDHSGLRIVKVLDDRIKHKYHALDDVPHHVRIHYK